MSTAPAGSVPTMEVVQSSGAAGEIIHQMDASLLEVRACLCSALSSLQQQR